MYRRKPEGLECQLSVSHVNSETLTLSLVISIGSNRDSVGHIKRSSSCVLGCAIGAKFVFRVTHL